jgi:hypothetical protein
LNGENGSLLWSYALPIYTRSSPTIGDVDGNGDIEVVVSGTNGVVHAFNGEDGSVLWSHTVGGWLNPTVALGDIDGDGKLEVVIGNDNSGLYALNGEDGSQLWHNSTTVNWSSPALGDIDGDGNLEVVVGSLDDKVYGFNGGDGSLVWSYTTGGDVECAPALADIDGDGELEVVFGSVDGKIYALNGTDIYPPQPFSLISPPDSTDLTLPRPTFVWESSADLESGLADYDVYVDNVLEHTLVDTSWTADYDLSEDWHTWYIIAHDSAGNSRQSNETWSFVIDMTGPVIESTTVWTDTSYIGPFDILSKVWDELTGVDSVVLHYKRDEDPDWISTAMAMAGSPDWYIGSIPAVANYDDSVRYYIEAVDIADPGNATTDPPGAPASYFAFIGNFTGIMEHQSIPKIFSFRLTSNPMRGRVAFVLALPSDAEVTVHIYDVVGRLVGTPISGRHAAGFHDVVWNSTAGAGIYFYSLESPWEGRTGKLVLLR